MQLSQSSAKYFVKITCLTPKTTFLAFDERLADVIPIIQLRTIICQSSFSPANIPKRTSWPLVKKITTLTKKQPTWQSPVQPFFLNG